MFYEFLSSIFLTLLKCRNFCFLLLEEKNVTKTLEIKHGPEWEVNTWRKLLKNIDKTKISLRIKSQEKQSESLTFGHVKNNKHFSSNTLVLKSLLRQNGTVNKFYIGFVFLQNIHTLLIKFWNICFFWLTNSTSYKAKKGWDWNAGSDMDIVPHSAASA